MLDAPDQNPQYEQEDDVLSFGQRIANGGAPRPPMDYPRPTAATPQAQPDVPAPSIKSVMSAQPPQAFPVEDTPKMPLTPPGPNVGDLLQRKAQLNQPIDPRQKQYRMGWGQRLAGIAGNALSGFSRDGSAPVYTGPDATNHRYAVDERMRIGQLGNVEGQISDQEKLAEENRKMFEAATQGVYRQGQYDKLEGMAQSYKDKADQAEKALNEKTREFNEKLEQQQNAADNKVPTSDFAGWWTAFRRDNGRPPTAKEIADHEVKKAAAGKDNSAADTAKAIQIAEFKTRQLGEIDQRKESERRARYAEADKDIQSRYNPEKQAAAKKKIDDELDTKYQQQIKSVSDEADKMFGITKAGAKLQSGNTPARPNAQAAKPAGKPKAGDTITVDGKPFMVTGINPKTGKPQGYYTSK